MRRALTMLTATFVLLAGLGLLADAGATSIGDFHIVYLARNFACGSVLSAKDPRDLVSKRVRVPPALQVAYQRCETERSDRSHKAAVLLIAGAIPILALLITPAFVRRRRRARHHRRRY